MLERILDLGLPSQSNNSAGADGQIPLCGMQRLSTAAQPSR